MIDSKDYQLHVTVSVEGQLIDGWKSYRLESNLLTPADSFTLVAPFDRDVHRACRMDARVRVSIDGAPFLDGFIETRRKSAKEGTLTIGGRNRAGRVVSESAPAINYSGLKLFDAIKLLADPWIQSVTASDARNRTVRRGKGRKVPSGTEPIEINVPVPKAGHTQPGMSRWAVIEELVSAAGLLAWESADGKEIFVGKPNQKQAAQYIIRHVAAGSRARSTCIDLTILEDIGDCFSLIQVTGAGGGSSTNYGADVVGRFGVARDGIEVDGTGNSFLYPKRLLMPEKGYSSNKDAQEIADREMRRRNYRKKVITAEMPGHGQVLSSVTTLFAPNTMARVIDEEIEYDEACLITGVVFVRDDGGSVTTLEMVPEGTEVVL